MPTIQQRRKVWEWQYLVDVLFFVNLTSLEGLIKTYELPPDKARDYVNLHLKHMKHREYFEVASAYEKGVSLTEVAREYKIDDFYLNLAVDVYRFKSTHFPKEIDYELTSGAVDYQGLKIYR